MVDEALAERDHATHTFMQWFVNEQVEEEAIVRNIVSDMELIIESRDGLFLMDRDLAGRKPQAEGEGPCLTGPVFFAFEASSRESGNPAGIV